MTNVLRRDWTKRTTQPLSPNPKPFTDVRIKGGLWGTIRILGTLQPERLFPLARTMWQGAVIGKTTPTVAILDVEHVGEHEIASLSTSTQTYIAAGLLCHNSHGDPGAIRLDLLAALPPPTKPIDPPTPTDPTTGDDEMTLYVSNAEPRHDFGRDFPAAGIVYAIDGGGRLRNVKPAEWAAAQARGLTATPVSNAELDYQAAV
jgi:hypothetical protein